MSKSNRRQSRKSTAKGRPSRSTASAVNAWAVAKRGSEHKWYNTQSTNQQLYHNVAVALGNHANLLDLITQGGGIANRVGLAISVTNLSFRLVLNNKSDRANVSYRCVVVASPATTSTDTFAELFSGGYFTGVHLPSNSLLLHDATFPTNQGSGMENNPLYQKERSFNHAFDVPINHSVQYNSDNYCQTRLQCYVICYDAHGTLITDNIASIAQYSFRIDFVDP